ncbi:hypothetical protein MBRA1_000883 [Malassezia brasiliensis]|uniref:C2 domain-containing protein n=1 Tax=Malassezia brasiliensis TaxID=1821822 RepID=A0AAF0DT32_9BASI|nr:hypothetical protein MBRA1_000883 [Malassezia brasiliensis]
MSQPLSQPSASSSAQAKRGVTDGDIYVYTLQTAYLAHLVAQAQAAKAPATRPPVPRRSMDSRMNLAERVRDLKLSAAPMRQARFPEKFVRKLLERLERIAMGRDAHFHAPLFRQTIGAFYGTAMDAATVKSLKENRSVEELLLLFFNDAQTSLKKRVPDEAGRRAELEREVALFARVVRETLVSVGATSREWGERIDESTQMFVSSLQRSVSEPDMPVDVDAASSPLVRAVGNLFGVHGEQLALDIDSIRPLSTLAAGMLDLKRCVYRIHAQQAWPAAPDDFASPSEYRTWRSGELNALSQMMVAMCEAQPDLLSTPTAGDSLAAGRMPRASTELSTPELGDGDEDGEMTFVPPDTHAAYQRVLERCIDVDLDAIRQKAEDEEVSLAILSAVHMRLLDVCAERWRVARPFRVLANLRTIKARFDCGEVPMECVQQSLERVAQLVHEADPTAWRRQERNAMRRALDSLADTLLRSVYAQFQAVYEANVDELRPTVELVEQIEPLVVAVGGGVRTDAAAKQLPELHEALRISAIQSYTAKTTEVLGGDSVRLLDACAQLLDYIHAKVKELDRKFAGPILSVSPVDVVIQKVVPLYLDDLESLRESVLVQVAASDAIEDVDDALALWERVRALMALYDATRPAQPLTFHVRRWFAPYVERWLALTERRASQWVQNALQVDTFEPMGDGAEHSTSIRDLSDALEQPLAVLQGLAWPDAYEQACFYTMLAKSYGRLIEEYCRAIEDLYMAEMLPARAEATSTPVLGGLLDTPLAAEYVASLPPKQAAWVAKAKQTIAGEKKVQPFLFQTQSCVKLNNIEAARHLLDALYRRMDADRQAHIVAEHLRTADEADTSVVSVDERAPLHYLFTVKVVQAELNAGIADTPGERLAARLDTFVTLSDAQGERLAKTRTIYDRAQPRWDEVFDIPATALLWVSATVWRRQFGHEPSLLGRAPLRLDPRLFRDENAHEVWLSLDSGGKLLVRISMEDAHDDILFHFGRAFRVLKRANVDMVRVLVDHISLFMRQFLSRSVVRSLVRGGRVNLDRALGNVKALYASALAQANGTATLIPPVDTERRRAGTLSDQEIEAAIVPLLDYFEVTLGTLKSSLSETQSQFVLTRVWKEVLNTLESILVPPLSDLPTDMRELSPKEVDIVFKWLGFLKNYFNAYDEETHVAHGVPLDILQGPKYRELLSYLLLHDQSTDQLMVECVRGFQTRLATSPAARRAKSKSVLHQRSLGTIRARKQSKAEEDHTHTDMAMKILRMRPGTGDFLTQQLISMNSLQQSMAPRPTAGAPGLRRTSHRLSALMSR